MFITITASLDLVHILNPMKIIRLPTTWSNKQLLVISGKLYNIFLEDWARSNKPAENMIIAIPSQVIKRDEAITLRNVRDLVNGN